MLGWIMGLRPVRLVQKTLQQWTSDDGSLLAAAVSYYAALSFFPLLLVLTSLMGLFFKWTRSGADAQQQVLAAIAEYGSPQLQEQVAQMLERIQDKAGVGGPLGMITLLIAAIGLFAQFEKAFDRIWNVPEKPGQGILTAVKTALFDRLRAFLMLLGVGALIVVTFVASLVLAAIQQRAQQWLPVTESIWWVVQISASILLNMLAFTLLFTVVPKVHVPWRKGLLGGLLTAIVWEAGRLVLSAFVISNKYSAYGIIGSFLAVMLWIYYASTVVFIGAEFVQVTTQGAEEEEA